MSQVKKVLIANRGEIAVRIIRTLKEMNIKSVAIYSPVDVNSLHVFLADEAFPLVGNRPAEGYLDQNQIIEIAQKTNSDAIHPGYGFLAENATFSQRCHDNNITFIGPSGEIINQMGDKDSARKLAKLAGVPIIPGSRGLVKDIDQAIESAREIGYPILIKATAGGGGKGMRIASDEAELIKNLPITMNEAQSAFGNGDCYIEKLIINPRHIEVQILGDNFGNVIHLFERECSMQRNNQKMIEEAPAVHIKEETRVNLTRDAVKLAKQINYSGAGTIEFVMDNSEKYYFIEMNTRIQVEHPVTEQITNTDIVKMQIQIANNQKLMSQEDVKLIGHSIECRVNAEDPDKNFTPSPGTVEKLFFPGGNGIRIDSHIYSGASIPQFYDSMIGKIIVTADNRNVAIKKMNRALDEIIVTGIDSNIDFQKHLINSEEFNNNSHHTKTIEEMLKDK